MTSQIKAIEKSFPVVLINMLHKVANETSCVALSDFHFFFSQIEMLQTLLNSYSGI